MECKYPSRSKKLTKMHPKYITMEGIYTATDEFPFSKLLLLKPTAVSGGNYFIKFRINELPLYIQTPKCNTKQGILKAGKKYFSDLMFTNEHESFIQWIEKLENYSQKYIYDHRESWFDTELDLHDIENSFSSCFKLYKSGKYYIVRTHVPTQMGKCSLKIYNDNEELVEHDEITDKNDIITILEIQGIKCSARSFQIEIEIKQMLVLPDNNLFEKCILVKGRQKSEVAGTTEHLGKTLPSMVIPHHDISNTDNTVVDKGRDHEAHDYSEYTDTELDNPSKSSIQLGGESSDSEVCVDTSMGASSLNAENPKHNDIEHNADVDNHRDSEVHVGLGGPYNPSGNNELEEVELSLDEISEDEQMQIKARNDIYYKMYQDAKKKAKLAKDLALSAYLEAKRIKNTYMLEDLDDSDSDLDEDTASET